MSATAHNAFHWRDQPSANGEQLKRTQTAPKKPTASRTYTKKPVHPLRNATSSINTEAVDRLAKPKQRVRAL